MCVKETQFNVLMFLVVLLVVMVMFWFISHYSHTKWNECEVLWSIMLIFFLLFHLLVVGLLFNKRMDGKIVNDTFNWVRKERTTTIITRQQKQHAQTHDPFLILIHSHTHGMILKKNHMILHLCAFCFLVFGYNSNFKILFL